VGRALGVRNELSNYVMRLIDAARAAWIAANESPSSRRYASNDSLRGRVPSRRVLAQSPLGTGHLYPGRFAVRSWVGGAHPLELLRPRP
jgi:hypothetical protein